MFYQQHLKFFIQIKLIYFRLYEIKIFHRKEILTIQNVSAKCAKSGLGSDPENQVFYGIILTD